MIKTLFFSLLSCSLLGFSFLQTDDPQLLRTPEGMIIIPSTANVSEEDAAEVLRLVSQESEPVAHFAYNVNGESGIYGNYGMQELVEINRAYGSNVKNVNGINIPIFGHIFSKKERKCFKIYGDTKCDEFYKFREDTAGGAASQGLISEIQEVLDKYGYIEVELNPGE